MGAIFAESTRARGIRSRRVVSGRAIGMGQVDAIARPAAVSATSGRSERLPKNESSFDGERCTLNGCGRAADCCACAVAGAARRASARAVRKRSDDIGANERVSRSCDEDQFRTTRADFEKMDVWPLGGRFSVYSVILEEAPGC
jgi:hypothetical protein